jgi:Tfp pilus assembly protein PilO
VTILALAYVGYLGWDYYSYLHDETSPLIVARKDLDAAKGDNVKLQARVKDGEAFLKSLESKRVELRSLAGELDSIKGTLSENLDLPEFMKTVLTEARRVGLFVVSLKPAGYSEKEYYGEHTFDFAFRGVFVQMMLFLDHMANVQKIVRVDNFNIRPRGSTSGRYVEIDGTVQLSAYRYIASKADALGREATPGAVGAPSTPAVPSKDGG